MDPPDPVLSPVKIETLPEDPWSEDPDLKTILPLSRLEPPLMMDMFPDFLSLEPLEIETSPLLSIESGECTMTNPLPFNRLDPEDKSNEPPNPSLEEPPSIRAEPPGAKGKFPFPPLIVTEPPAFSLPLDSPPDTSTDPPM